MSFSIAGKTAIVTGAANGVGLAIARHFVDQGANVMMADRDEEALQREHGDLTEGPARIFAGDLCERLTIANLISATVDAFERVDVLVNASRRILPSDPLDPDGDQVMELLRQNLMTSLRLSQQVARRMIKQSGDGDDDDQTPAGAIVNLSSIAARRASPELMAYTISTAAVEHMTRALAVSLAPSRIRVNAVSMGSVLSANLNTMLQEDEGLRDRILHATPAGRIADPSEVAETVQFLTSDASRFMTGEVVTLDGGRSLLDPVSSPTY